MADMGIRRPEEFEGVFERLRYPSPKGFGIAEKFTEIIVLAAFVGFHFDRDGKGPFHRNPVEWKNFSTEEKNRLFVLAVAQTMRSDGKPDPGILSRERQPELFKLIEKLAHGGLLEMRDNGVFSDHTEEGYGQGLTNFVQEALTDAETDKTRISVEDLLRDLEAYM